MALRPIVLYPDPVLLRPTRPVEQVDEDVRRLVADMIETLYAAPGVGLAANQVADSRRVCIVDLTAGEEQDSLFIFVNPTILEETGSDIAEEGCLSFPDVTLDIQRASAMRVTALDLDGKEFELAAEGLLARAILHECEHLKGHVFLRNVSSLKREHVKRQIRKRIKAGDWSPVAT